MKEVTKVASTGEQLSAAGFHPEGWYKATVPGTVLTTLVDNGVYPEPLYGENMHSIPESLNKTSYWYYTTVDVPATARGNHVCFGGVNYAADVWVDGHNEGTMRGAFIRGNFDITKDVKAGHTLEKAVALMAHMQLHRQSDGQRVLPVFYSDNYISLVPRESRTVTVSAKTVDLSGSRPILLVDGYNIDVVPVSGAAIFRRMQMQSLPAGRQPE